MTYGDGLSDINLTKLLRFHKKNKKLATVTAVRPPARFGTIEMSNGLVTKFAEKDAQDAGWINGGFFCLNKKVCAYISDTTTSFESEPLNHLVSSIAYKVCNEVNMKTDVSDAAADILNHSAFVQMYTLATKRKDQFVINGFNTVWPSKLFTEVTLEAQKSYSSTSSSGGKLVFNINKTPKTIPNEDSGPGPEAAPAVAPAKTSTADLDAVADRSSDIKAADTQAMGSDETLGRPRRRR